MQLISSKSTNRWVTVVSTESNLDAHVVRSTLFRHMISPSKITIPAVKITGEIIVTSTSSDNLLLPIALCPDPCVSHVADDDDDEHVQELRRKNTFKKATLPLLLSDEDAEAEFDSFLLDAAQWL